MEESILKSTKKLLGVGDDDTSFDVDIITHINSAFSVLHQLGIGPEDGFMITDDEPVWQDFTSYSPDGMGNEVQTIVYLRVRLLFDPPTTPFALSALEKQIVEHEWRVNVNRERTAWVDPNPPIHIVDLPN